jgi:hypothetical protein
LEEVCWVFSFHLLYLSLYIKGFVWEYRNVQCSNQRKSIWCFGWLIQNCWSYSPLDSVLLSNSGTKPLQKLGLWKSDYCRNTSPTTESKTSAEGIGDIDPIEKNQSIKPCAARARRKRHWSIVRRSVDAHARNAKQKSQFVCVLFTILRDWLLWWCVKRVANHLNAQEVTSVSHQSHHDDDERYLKTCGRMSRKYSRSKKITMRRTFVHLWPCITFMLLL